MVATFGENVKRVRAYVVFQQSSTPAFWDILTAPAWRHCWLMMPVSYPEPGLMASRFTMKVEPLRWGIDTDVWFEDPAVIAQYFYRAGVTAIVAVDVDLPPRRLLHSPRGPINCVTVVKACLGVAAWHVWTPRQLFAYLLRHCGGQLVRIEEGNGNNGRSG